MPKLVLGLIVIALIAVGGYYLINKDSSYMSADMPSDNTMMYDTVKPAQEVMQSENTISLDEQNDSDEMGIATLREENGKTIVKIEMKGAPSGTPQPAHIHTGSCPDVGAVVYPLSSVVDGMSETTLDVSLKDLAAKQPLGINVHKSVAEAKVYVSCGNLAL